MQVKRILQAAIWSAPQDDPALISAGADGSQLVEILIEREIARTRMNLSEIVDGPTCRCAGDIVCAKNQVCGRACQWHAPFLFSALSSLPGKFD